VITDGDWDDHDIRMNKDHTRGRTPKTIVKKSMELFDQIHFLIG